MPYPPLKLIPQKSLLTKEHYFSSSQRQELENRVLNQYLLKMMGAFQQQLSLNLPTTIILNLSITIQ